MSGVLTALSAYTPKEQWRRHWPEAQTRWGQLQGSSVWLGILASTWSRPAARAGDRRAGTRRAPEVHETGERTLRRGLFVTPENGDAALHAPHTSSVGGPCRGHPGHSDRERGLPPRVTVSQAHAHVIKNQAQPRSVFEALCPAVATKTTVPGTGLRQHQLPRTGPSCPRGGPVLPAQERGCSQNPGAAGARRALSVHAWRVGVGRGGVG